MLVFFLTKETVGQYGYKICLNFREVVLSLIQIYRLSNLRALYSSLEVSCKMQCNHKQLIIMMNR